MGWGESLGAFVRGKLIGVPGGRYKILVAFLRATPGAMMRRLSARLGRRYRKTKA